MESNDCVTRWKILQAALSLFADRGYAGTSVQDIVSAAQVTKPTLYYYFENKAALYQALVDWAHDERYRRMQDALGRAQTIEGRLVEILATLFEFLREHRDLVRVVFATAFAAPGEMPAEIHFREKGERNLELVHALVVQGQKDGVLDRGATSLDLAYAILGAMNLYVMRELVRPGNVLDRTTAERIVNIFMAGAATRG